MSDYARGERFLELRESKHLSQEAAAYAIGVTTKTIRSWEHGGKIKWENARRVARFFEVEPETLVTRDIESDPMRLVRIEAKLDLLLSHFDVADVEELEQLANGDGPASVPAPGQTTSQRG